MIGIGLASPLAAQQIGGPPITYGSGGGGGGGGGSGMATDGSNATAAALAAILSASAGFTGDVSNVGTALTVNSFGSGTAFGPFANGTAASNLTGPIFTLAPGLTNTPGTYNPGTVTAASGDTISGQLIVKTVAASCTVDVNCDGANSNAGEMLVPTAGSVTLTAPNPSSITKGRSQFFGSNGVVGYTVTTVGGTATLYGCTGAGSGVTSLTVDSNLDMVITDDGTNYKCSLMGSRVVAYALTIGPGVNPNGYPMVTIPSSRTITGIVCRPETLAGGTATVDLVKAASATAITGGTTLNTTACNANSGAATVQDLGVTVSTLAANDTIGLKSAQTTIWTSSGVALGVYTIYAR
jgi:hypothetical protein